MSDAHVLARSTTHQNADKCSICFEETSSEGADGCRTRCGHSFHTSCLAQWIKAAAFKLQEPTCPNCRSAVVEENEEQTKRGDDFDEAMRLLYLATLKFQKEVGVMGLFAIFLFQTFALTFFIICNGTIRLLRAVWKHKVFFGLGVLLYFIFSSESNFL